MQLTTNMSAFATNKICSRVKIDVVKPSTAVWVLPSDTPKPYRTGVVPGTIDMDAFVNDLKKSAAACSSGKHSGTALFSVAASLLAAAAVMLVSF